MKTHLTLNTGYNMPTLGLGTWNSQGTEVPDAVEYAVLKAGYRHIDCASIYGNQAQIGSAFKKIFKTGEVKREELFITSKLWNTDHHPDNVEAACRQTLKDLGLEYLDLYLIHWGLAFKHGADTKPKGTNGEMKLEAVPIQDTWQAMEKLVAEGLVKSIGLSNFTPPMILDLLTYAKIKPAVLQVELHPYHSQTGLLKLCQHRKIAVTGYSPLGTSGIIAADAPRLLDDPTVVKIAKAHHKSVAQVLLNWAVARGTIVIPKSTKPVRIIENSQFYDFKLSPAETKAIDALNRNHRFVNPVGVWGIPYFN